MSNEERQRELKRSYKMRERAILREQIGLTKGELERSLDFLDLQSGERPCDHSLRDTERWAREKNVDFEALRSALSELGAFCDCEVLLKIEPGDVAQSGPDGGRE